MIPISIENKGEDDICVVSGWPLHPGDPDSFELKVQKILSPVMHVFVHAAPIPGPMFVQDNFITIATNTVPDKSHVIRVGKSTLIHAADFKAEKSQYKRSVHIPTKILVGKKVVNENTTIRVNDVRIDYNAYHDKRTTMRRMRGQEEPFKLGIAMDPHWYLIFLMLSDGRIFVPWSSDYESVVRKLQDIQGLFYLTSILNDYPHLARK